MINYFYFKTALFAGLGMGILSQGDSLVLRGIRVHQQTPITTNMNSRYKNVVHGNGSDWNLNIRVSMTPTAWKKLISFHEAKEVSMWPKFGQYFAQFAANNLLPHSCYGNPCFVNLPDANVFPLHDCLVDHFGTFGKQITSYFPMPWYLFIGSDKSVRAWAKLWSGSDKKPGLYTVDPKEVITFAFVYKCSRYPLFFTYMLNYLDFNFK